MQIHSSSQAMAAMEDAFASHSRSPMRETRVSVRGGIEGARSHDLVAEEIPVAMVYNGVSHAVMMASPCDLEDFALGFSLSEGILQRPDQLFSVEIKPSEDGIEVDMHIAGDCYARLREQRRNMAGRTGCGLCGTESLAHVVRTLEQVTPQPLPSDKAVQDALKNLKQSQPLQLQTGATHGAAWCDSQGRIILAREDVGRHNALDKLIGAHIRKHGEQAFNNGFALISSRASFEMVQKSASVGIGSLVAVSAPTALAIREARKSGMNLIKMLDQIIANNLHHGDDDKVTDVAADHLQKFWARSMKQQVIVYASENPAELSQLSRLTINKLAENGKNTAQA